MSNIGNIVKTLKGPQGPGALKSVLAGLAIAWGSRTAMRVAEDATTRTVEATAYLGDINAAIKDAETSLIGLNDITHERYVATVRDGLVDEAVKARAAILGWQPAPRIDMEALKEFAATQQGEPYTFGPVGTVDPLNLQDAIDANRDAGD